MVETTQLILLQEIEKLAACINLVHIVNGSIDSCSPGSFHLILVKLPN